MAVWAIRIADGGLLSLSATSHALVKAGRRNPFHRLTTFGVIEDDGSQTEAGFSAGPIECGAQGQTGCGNRRVHRKRDVAGFPATRRRHPQRRVRIRERTVTPLPIKAGAQTSVAGEIGILEVEKGLAGDAVAEDPAMQKSELISRSVGFEPEIVERTGDIGIAGGVDYEITCFEGGPIL